MNQKANQLRTHCATSALLRAATHQWPGLIAAVTLLACGAVPEDDIVSAIESPIQAGKDESGYPAVGLLGRSSGYCTSELIAPSVLLTAAHCVGPSMVFNTGTEPSDFTQYSTDAYLQHSSRDLALVHLSKALTTITPLSLNTGTLPATDSKCTAVGFGAHNEANGTVTGQEKRSATVKVESATSTTITVVMDTGIPDHGDSGGPLLCGSGSKVVGVVRRHDDGNWPVHVRELYTTIDADWINAHLSLAPVPVTYGLAVAQGARLHRANGSFDYWSLISSADWTGATSMTSFNGSLYVIQNSRLHKVKPNDGTYTVLGNADWAGPTSMTALGSNLYITQDHGLWKITNLGTGAYTRVGTADWTGATSMTSLDGSLYIIQNSRLHRVNPSNGSYVVLGDADWPGRTTMTTVGSSLYVTQDQGLWKITNLSTGAHTRVGTADWTDATSMTSFDRSLYIIQNRRVHKVSPIDGSYTVLSSADWGGNTAIAALRPECPTMDTIVLGTGSIGASYVNQIAFSSKDQNRCYYYGKRYDVSGSSTPPPTNSGRISCERYGEYCWMESGTRVVCNSAGYCTPG